MKTGVSAASGALTCSFSPRNLMASNPISKPTLCLVLTVPKTHQSWRCNITQTQNREKRSTRLSSIDKKTEDTVQVPKLKDIDPSTSDKSETPIIVPKVAERLARKKSERHTYLVAAIMSSLGVTSAAVTAVYYRFSWQMEVNSEHFSFLVLKLNYHFYG